MPGMPLLSSAATTVVQANPTAIRIPLITSGSVEGNTTWVMVWNLLAPSESAAVDAFLATPRTPLMVAMVIGGNAARNSSHILEVSPIPNQTIKMPM